jgi:hypothetical protein
VTHADPGRVRWTATDPGRLTRARLVETGNLGELLLVLDTHTGDEVAVALPEAALRRGAQATGAWLIEHAELRAEQARRLVDDLRLLTDAADEAGPA